MIKRSYLAALLIAAPALAQQPSRSDYHALGRAILRELIETNTTASAGNTTVAAEQLQVRFKDAGFAPEDDQVVGPTPKNRNLVVRYRGSGAHKPVLLLAHLDVVEAKRDDWTYDPFVLTEKDGYFYGRGTQDVKGGAAMLVAALLRMKQEKIVPDRDFILALTAGEEGGMPYNGVQWLIANQRPLIDAEYVINVDAGGGELENGKHTLFDVQAAEKVFHSVSLTAKNPGGHSSLPRKDNAIYELAKALERVGAYEFPAKPNDVVKKYFMQASATVAPQVAADMRAVAAGTATPAAVARLSTTPLYNALMRTTCVATMLNGGHAPNALPQTATALVNCRMLPGDDPAAVEQALVRAIGDTGVHLAPIDTARPSPASPLRPDVFSAVEASVNAVWGKVPVVPIMETGATDGLFLRNAGVPVYAFSGLFIATNDVRAHGKDERILVTAFDDGLDFTYDFLKRITR
ncbi:MAG TPA: M20/M25/M40 family metallo-hydrolase [Gemmatimonadaceae bacterium]|jgi:acetylornithine deacetylase/succinyl-diaminopimelate desuccinylase-like protein|nr:M20/M25/M40 family metallo-hydrolase [Gemmatimonadaceae bacterium]